ncbi:MAG: EAL domain-containing protein [Blautia wexlerae]
MDEQKKSRMIITMGNHMKLSIIAEGVETEQQKVMLQGFGCNKAQGYFYARPVRKQNIPGVAPEETKQQKIRCDRRLNKEGLSGNHHEPSSSLSSRRPII